MPERLTDRVALITGAGSGLGRGMALAFALEGAHVVVNDIDAAGARQTALMVTDIGRKSMIDTTDITSSDQVEHMVEQVVAQMGSVDILVNNAGIASEIVPTIDQSPQKWSRVVAVNLQGAYLCSRRVGRVMIERGRGTILNMSSITAYGGFPMRCSYGPSKAGLKNLTETLAVEWGAFGIRVVALAPGHVVTPFLEKLAAEGKADIEAMTRRTPLRRLPTVEDVANAAVFLVSDEAACITGVTLPVDGGWLAYRSI